MNLIVEMIACMGANNVIGAGGKMPWSLPADMSRFQKMTMDKAVLMGMTTFRSIGRMLPGRHNYVLSHTAEPDVVYDCVRGIYLCSDMIKMLEYIDKWHSKVLVIGGQSIYEQLLPHADRIHATSIHSDFEGDAYFPELSYDEWRLVSEIQKSADIMNGYGYSFLEYERIWKCAPHNPRLHTWVTLEN